MPQLIPGIGVRGVFTLKPPFAALLLANTPYQVVAVRQLADIVAAGADPQATYYTARGLDQSAYDTDLADAVVIVSLQSSSGTWVYVPSSYILAMPDQGGVPYTVMALAVSLGPVANALDLSYAKAQVSQLVADTLGLDPVKIEVHEVALSTTSNVSQQEHRTLEAARLARQSEQLTEHAKLLAMTAQRDALATQLQAMQTQLADAISKGYTGTASPPAP